MNNKDLWQVQSIEETLKNWMLIHLGTWIAGICLFSSKISLDAVKILLDFTNKLTQC